ncbi:gas vesicle protein K [Candidatus Bipolaricaulota bacterium]|nr:gas vesicle protein K [Candidatus Bipolaricaulota bacterium]
MSEVIDIEEDELKTALLGLVMALVEVVRDTLKIQALRRMDSGRLTEDEIERLGIALYELDVAIEEIESEHELEDAVHQTRDGLNQLVDEVLNPETWKENIEAGTGA